MNWSQSSQLIGWRTLQRCGFALGMLAAVAATAQADVKLPAIFGDNMALQAGQKLPVWGTADPNEEVEVRVTASKVEAGEAAASADVTTQTQRTKADDQGHWKLTLAPLPATDEPVGFTVTGKNKVSLENVVVGDVWVCSGQSNMEWPLQSANNAKEEIAKADFPNVRLFLVKKRVEATAPTTELDGKWQICTPQTVAGFSAVGYFFGRTLEEATGNPIGLIGTYWGGTPAEAWTSQASLEADKTFAPILDRWKQADQKAEKDGKSADARVQGPKHPHHPAGLYNGMIAPIVPYAIKGAIWYQGETNAGRAYQYRTLFPAMITDWRGQWKQGDFPFLFVQLANFQARRDEPQESAWAELREAQSLTLKLPNTGQAVIIDIGEAKNIHPRNKQDVGARLALAALKVAYDEDVVYSGPTFKSMTASGKEAVLMFDHVGAGLNARGGELKGFAVAGKDRKFHWADARIDGDKVVVSSPEVSNPVAVRYGWADNPEVTLYNAEELPASPFRTDDWPGVTVNNK